MSAYATLAAASSEVLVLDASLPDGDDAIGNCRRIHHVNLRRGVRYRIILPDSARMRGELDALVLSGADVRTVARVPSPALVVDRKFAALPSETGLVLFQLPSVVRMAIELFEQVWCVATPAMSGGDDYASRETELLALLSAGCTDETAAAKLGISVRTVRRMVAGIMTRLGARSRFQAGAEAAARGLLGFVHHDEEREGEALRVSPAKTVRCRDCARA